MKKLLLSALLLPVFGIRAGAPTENLVEVRGGVWPINLEKNVDGGVVSYSLIYRDQASMNGNVLDTLPFDNLQQLQYFAKGLSALKAGHNGDIARFKDYTLKRADKKFDGVWYMLNYQSGQTSFQQPEADIMGKTIGGL